MSSEQTQATDSPPSWKDVADINIPQDAVIMHKALQDKSYTIADLKIILNPGKHDEKTMYSRIEFLKQHNEYMANLLDQKYSDVETVESVKSGPQSVVKIEEDCPTELMEILFTCLCSKKVKETNSSEFTIEYKGKLEKITFESLSQLVLFANLAKKWNIECFNFSQLRSWYTKLIENYNEWFIGYCSRAVIYNDTPIPKLKNLDPTRWECCYCNSHDSYSGTKNEASAETCSRCHAPRHTPRSVISTSIADLTPLRSIDERIFFAWLNFLGDSCEDFYFFSLAHASKSHRRVSQNCFMWLKKHVSEKYSDALKNDCIIDRIFRTTWFDITDGTSCLKETVTASDENLHDSKTGKERRGQDTRDRKKRKLS